MYIHLIYTDGSCVIYKYGISAYFTDRTQTWDAIPGHIEVRSEPNFSKLILISFIFFIF